MISTSDTYNRIINANGRKFYSGATVTLQDGTELELDERHLMADGGFKIEDAVTEPDKFQIGAAIINELTLKINNYKGDFNAYDFSGAVIKPWVGLLTKVHWKYGEIVEKLNKGIFTVFEAPTVGDTITIVADDNMAKLDVAYSNSSLEYPATLGEIAADVCSVCGVTLATASFPNSDYVVDERPTESSITCREILSYVAELAGCFARCNTDGEIEIRWYEEPLSGNLYDVGKSAYEMSYDTYDTVITGVKIQDDDGNIYSSGTDDFVIRIKDNPLAQNNLQSLVENIGSRLNGYTFRSYSVSSPSNPAIEAGDIVYMTDKKGTIHKTLVSSLEYTFGSYETFAADAETPAENQSERFSAAEKAQEAAEKAQAAADAANENAESVRQEFKAADGILESKIENTETELTSKIEQTESSLTTTINDTKNGLQTQITQNSNSILLKADKSNLISQINICPERIKISSDKVELTGLVTISSLEDGDTTIDGACIRTGRIESEDGGWWLDLDDGEFYLENGTFSGTIEWETGTIRNSNGSTVIEANSIDIHPVGSGRTYAKNLDIESQLFYNGSTPASGSWTVQMKDGTTHRWTFRDGLLMDSE